MINSQQQSSLRYKVNELVKGLKIVWAISSAVERLPYKQDVPGSNPGSPIHKNSKFLRFENLNIRKILTSGLFR